MSSKTLWDRIGIFLSGLCAIHCLFFPVAIALLPLWQVADSIHGWTHPLFFLLIIPTVYFAIRTRKVPRKVSVLLASGLAVLAISWVLHGNIDLLAESAVTTMGSLLLIAGHWLNYKHHTVQNCSFDKNMNAG